MPSKQLMNQEDWIQVYNIQSFFNIENIELVYS